MPNSKPYIKRVIDRSSQRVSSRNIGARIAESIALTGFNDFIEQAKHDCTSVAMEMKLANGKFMMVDEPLFAV